MNTNELENKLVKYNLDTFLQGNELREPNWFYKIYKLSILSIGSSGSGKTTFLINQLLNNVYDVSIIIFFLPMETIKSGFYHTLFENIKDILPNVKIVISNLTKKSYDNEIEIINDNVVMYNRFLTFYDVMELKNDFYKKTKNKKPFLLVFDDFISMFSKFEWQEFYEYLFNASRLNSFIYCCVQAFNEIPPQIRSNFTVIILFTNYLTYSVVRTILTNSIPLDLTKKDIDDLIHFIKSSPNKHEPLILIGSTAEKDKKIIYDNQYITFS